MFSCIGKSSKKKKSSKVITIKAQTNEEYQNDQKDYQTACLKVDRFYPKLHSIMHELKELTGNKALFTNPIERISMPSPLSLLYLRLSADSQVFLNEKWISTVTDHFKLFKAQISYTIETVNKVEENYGLEKLQFDAEGLYPLESFKTSCILEKCHQIELFLKDYTISIMKIQLEKRKISEENQNNLNKMIESQFQCSICMISKFYLYDCHN